MRKPIVVGVGIVLLLLSLTFGVWGINCHHAKKEAETYTVGPWTPKACPFPFYLDVKLPKEGDKEMVWKAAMELHAEVGGPLGYGPLFMPAENLSNRDGAFVVPVRPPNAEEKVRGGLCGPMIPKMMLEMGEGLVMGALRYEMHIASETLRRADIILCLDRINLLRSIKPKFLKVPRRTLDFYAKHELMHLLIGGGHPQWGCGITCADPHTRRVTETEIQIVRRAYDSLCVKQSLPKQ